MADVVGGFFVIRRSGGLEVDAMCVFGGVLVCGSTSSWPEKEEFRSNVGHRGSKRTAPQRSKRSHDDREQRLTVRGTEWDLIIVLVLLLL